MAHRLRALASLSLAGLVVIASVGVTDAAPPYELELPSGLRISGTVEDTHGSPVQGAEIEACTASEACGSTSTAADGSFTVRALVADSYLVRARPPEGANLLDVWATGAPGGSHDAGDAVAIEVAADVTGVDLQMPDGLRITGRVTSPEGDPVAGVSVVASDSPAGSWVPSGVDGVFEAVGLEPGSFSVRVSPPDDGEYPSGYVANGGVVASFDEATPVEVVDTDVDLGDIELFRGRTISGHVTRPSGTPVDVVALDADIAYPAHVDGSGAFTVRGLFPGAYHLLFIVPETGAFFDSQFPYGIYNGQGKKLASQNAAGVAVDVTAGNVAGLTATIPTLPRIEGTVRDTSGPVSGAGVLLCDDIAGCAAVTTGADGRFLARNVPAGSYTVQSGAAHHVVVGYDHGRSIPDGLAATPIAVGATGLTGIAIVLPNGGSLAGRVSGAGDVPAPGVEVSASTLSGGIWEFGPGGAVTDGNGDFVVGGLRDGDYRIAASPPEDGDLLGGYWSTSGWTPDSGSATVIPVDDAVPPTVTAPGLSFGVGTRIGTASVPVRIAWTAADPGSGVSRHRLQQQDGAGSWATVSSPYLPGLTRSYTPSSTHRLRVRATDFSANTSADVTGATFRVVRTEQSASALRWHGHWTTTSSSPASGHAYRRTDRAGASVRYRFSGRAVGWVATVGGGFGKAKVFIDGTYVRTVDLRQAASSRRIVFAKAWASKGTHTIKVVNLATPGRKLIDVDAFVVVK